MCECKLGRVDEWTNGDGSDGWLENCEKKDKGKAERGN